MKMPFFHAYFFVAETDELDSVARRRRLVKTSGSHDYTPADQITRHDSQCRSLHQAETKVISHQKYYCNGSTNLFFCFFAVKYFTGHR